MNVKMPELIYKGYLLLLLAAIIGLLIVLIRPRGLNWILAMLLALPVLNIIFQVYPSLTFPQPQGRILFPSLPAVCVLAALGLTVVPRLRKLVAVAVVLGCLTVNVYALTRVVYRAYWLNGQQCWTCQ